MEADNKFFPNVQKWHDIFQPRKNLIGNILHFSYKSDEKSYLRRLQQVFTAQIYCFSSKLLNYLLFY